MILPEDDGGVPCDLVFVQLAANFLKRNIILLPFYQNQNEKIAEDRKLITVISHHSDGKKPAFYMAYFPQGQFGPFNHFQSITNKAMDTRLKIPPTYVTEKFDVEVHTLTQNVIEEDEDVEEEVDNLFSINNDGTNQKEKYNGFNLVTMVTEKNPAESVFVNDTKEKITKRLRRGDSRVYEIAPGENKVS